MQQLIVKSLTGTHYTAQAIIDRNRRINGERDITLSFFFNEINSEFIKDIETGWKLNFQGDWYHLFNEKTDVNGNKSFSGVLDFYHYMNGFWHMDEVENKSMTVQDAMIPLFKDKEYVLQIIDNFTANTMSYSKQQNSTERFSYFVDRFNAEYNIPIGTKTVQLRNKIGVTRNDVIIHEDDNLEDLSIDIDSSSFCTAIKGYYDFQKPKNTKDGEELVPTKEYDYISPMAEKYGVIWGEPIHDERFSKLDSIKAACKEKQENSYKISYTIKKSLLSNALNEGDYVRFVAPSYNINTYVRVVEIKEQFDDDLDLIDEEYTFGNENIATAFSKMQYEAIRDVSDIMKGKKPIPYSVLPKAVREATTVINAGSTTQFYYREDGIYGYNTTNPLGVTRYNANGIGFSQDGGQTFQTAMTYLGIVANSITTGELIGLNITSPNEESYFHVNGGDAEFVSRTTGRKATLSPNGLYGYDRYGKLMFRADNTFVTSGALGTPNENVYLASDREVRAVHYASIPGDGFVTSYQYTPVRASQFYGNRLSVNHGTPGVNNLYLSTLAGGEVRITHFDTTDTFRPLRASEVFAYRITNNAEGTSNQNLYLSPSGGAEVIVTAPNSTDDYRTLRARSITLQSGDAIKSNVEGNMYIGVGGYELLVTDNNFGNNGNPSYRPVRALAFNNGSYVGYKKDIEHWDYDALSVIKDGLDIMQYRLKDDETQRLRRGVIVGGESKTPVEFINNDGVDLYEMTTWGLKGVQQLAYENDELKKENESLKQRMDKLEERLSNLEEQLDKLENK